jgi:hypothetical protein
MVERMQRNRNFCAMLVRMHNGWPPGIIVWWFLKKQNLRLPYDSVILLSIPKDLKASSQRVICTLMFIKALFTIAKGWKQPMPVDRLMDKQNVHIHTMENYPVLNRKKILTHAMT